MRLSIDVCQIYEKSMTYNFICSEYDKCLDIRSYWSQGTYKLVKVTLINWIPNILSSHESDIMNLKPSNLIADADSTDSFDGVEFHLYLFANPKSGSQKAKRYTDIGFTNCTINLGNNMRAITHVYNVIDKEERTKGLKKMGKR